MFESIAAKIATVIRNTAAATRRMPWLIPLTIVALVLIW
jgi:hypothetical protein